MKSLNNAELRVIKFIALQPTMLKCVRLFSEEDATKRTANVEQPRCSSRQSDVEKLVSDEDHSGTVSRINIEVFFGDLSSLHTSTAQAGNIWKNVRCAAHTL